ITEDHLAHIHLGLASNVASCLYRMPNHPIKRLIWPHVYGAIRINTTFVPILLDRAPVGSLWNIFSFTEKGLCEFIERKHSEFELRNLSPLCSGDSILALAEYFPKSTFADAIRIWHLVSEYVDAYVELYYPRNADIDTDPVLQEFLNRLRNSLP